VTAKVYGEVPPLAATVAVYATPALAAGSVAGDSVIVGTAIISVYDKLPAYGPAPVLESVAVIVNVSDPPAAGVPLRTPALVSDMPAGSPLAVNVYGDVPPLAVIVVDVYATPTVPGGSVDGDSVIMGAAMVSVYARLPVYGAPVPVLESVAVTVTLNVPPAVGLPDSTPALVSVRPAGRPVAVNVYGEVPPLAATAVEVYAAPTVPAVSADGVRLIVGAAIVIEYVRLPV
jgi:hypothetical protein